MVKDELPSPWSVQTVFETGKRLLITLEGYTPISEDELTVNGIPTIRHVFTIVEQGTTVQIMQLYLVSQCWQRPGVLG